MIKKIIFFSISSDISYYLAKKLENKYKIIGTYRNYSKKLSKLSKTKIIKLDVMKKNALNIFIRKNNKLIKNWDILVISIGNQWPLGPFQKINFNYWKKSFEVNYIKQMEILNKMLPFKAKNSTVLTWAGPATNNANKFYSAYTLSKIALIKSMELLDYEVNDCKFSILGPGWVKTKIHKTTIDNKNKVKASYKLTKKIVYNNSKKLTPFEEILKCFQWIVRSNKKIVGGRNFSIKYDNWGSPSLEKKLKKNINIYKLRRAQ